MAPANSAIMHQFLNPDLVLENNIVSIEHPSNFNVIISNIWILSVFFPLFAKDCLGQITIDTPFKFIIKLSVSTNFFIFSLCTHPPNFDQNFIKNIPGLTRSRSAYWNFITLYKIFLNLMLHPSTILSTTTSYYRLRWKEGGPVVSAVIFVTAIILSPLSLLDPVPSTTNIPSRLTVNERVHDVSKAIWSRLKLKALQWKSSITVAIAYGMVYKLRRVYPVTVSAQCVTQTSLRRVTN